MAFTYNFIPFSIVYIIVFYGWVARLVDGPSVIENLFRNIVLIIKLLSTPIDAQQGFVLLSIVITGVVVINWRLTVGLDCALVTRRKNEIWCRRYLRMSIISEVASHLLKMVLALLLTMVSWYLLIVLLLVTSEADLVLWFHRCDRVDVVPEGEVWVVMAVDSLLVLLELDLLLLQFIECLIILNYRRRKLVIVFLNFEVSLDRPRLKTLLSIFSHLRRFIVLATSPTAQMSKLICPLHDRPGIQRTIRRSLLVNDRALGRFLPLQINFELISGFGSASQRLVVWRDGGSLCRGSFQSRPDFLLLFFFHVLLDLSIPRNPGLFLKI